MSTKQAQPTVRAAATKFQFNYQLIKNLISAAPAEAAAEAEAATTAVAIVIDSRAIFGVPSQLE